MKKIKNYFILILLQLFVVSYSACTKNRSESYIRSIRIKNNKTISSKKIKNGLSLRERSWYWWFPFLGEKDKLNHAELEEDKERIISLYKYHGFFKTRIKNVSLEPDKESEWVDITLNLDEGPPVIISRILFHFKDNTPENVIEEVKKSISIHKNDQYNYLEIENSQEKIRQILNNNHYAYKNISVKTYLALNENAAHLHFTISTGPKVTLKSPVFKGAKEIDRKKLKHYLQWEPGDLYTQEKLEQTRQRLIGLNVFSSVKIDISKKPTDTTPVTINLKPAKLNELRFGFGVGLEQKRQEIRLSSLWTIRNFFGNLRVFTLSLKPAIVSQPTLWDPQRYGPQGIFEAKLVEPYIFDSSFSAFVLARYILEMEDSYQLHGPQFQIGVFRFFFSHLLKTDLSYNIEYMDFFNKSNEFDPSSTSLLRNFIDPYQVAWFEQTLSLELRDNPTDARSGIFASINLEQGSHVIGGDFSYLKVVPEFRAYIPLFTKRLILATRSEIGFLYKFYGDDTPITHRIYYGGAASHRGFNYKKLSPQTEKGTAFGGNASLLLSADLRYRVTKFFGNWFNVSAFIDAGDVVTEWAEININNLHYAIGGAAIYSTPIGAVRFSLGFRLNRLSKKVTSSGFLKNPDPDTPFVFHLTIGDAF